MKRIIPAEGEDSMGQGTIEACIPPEPRHFKTSPTKT